VKATDMTQPIKTRYQVTRDFDYLTVREYDVEVSKKYAYFRRTDDTSGCAVPVWQFKRALNDGSLVLA
jgi:hypothetical protein